MSKLCPDCKRPTRREVGDRCIIRGGDRCIRTERDRLKFELEALTNAAAGALGFLPRNDPGARMAAERIERVLAQQDSACGAADPSDGTAEPGLKAAAAPSVSSSVASAVPDIGLLRGVRFDGLNGCFTGIVAGVIGVCERCHRLYTDHSPSLRQCPTAGEDGEANLDTACWKFIDDTFKSGDSYRCLLPYGHEGDCGGPARRVRGFVYKPQSSDKRSNPEPASEPRAIVAGSTGEWRKCSKCRGSGIVPCSGEYLSEHCHECQGGMVWVSDPPATSEDGEATS